MAKKCTKKSNAQARLFFCQSKPVLLVCCSPSPLQKLPIVMIQKFCYHGNVTSHFSSLSEFPMNLTLYLLIGRIWGLWHDPLWENRDSSRFTEFCVFQASKDETGAGEGRESRDTLEATPASRFSLLALKKSEKIILFCRLAWQGKCYRNGEVNSGAREREEGLKFLHFTHYLGRYIRSRPLVGHSYSIRLFPTFIPDLLTAFVRSSPQCFRNVFQLPATWPT